MASGSDLERERLRGEELAPVEQARSSSIRRIVVALDASRSSLAALEAAADLAVALQAELSGLFVEDENLVRLAGLPLAREFDPISARPRSMSTSELRRHIAAQARRAQQALSERAERHKVTWSFRTVRGHVTRELRAAASAADLLVLGSRGRSPGCAVGSTARALLHELPILLLLAPAAGPRRGAVDVIFDGTEVGERALVLASDLALLRDLPLRVLLVPDGAPERLRDHAEAALGEHGRLAAYEELDPQRLQNTPARLRARGCGLLVASRAALLALGDEAAPWVSDLHCPLLVVD
jgi:nucleotide-binding universal stress UspA family protein